jgi:histidyl-tRNA synthetase
MFRYERPQSGRYRQFHQFGVETIGVKAYANDLEIITLICQMIKELNLSFKNLRLRYNFIGSFEQRAK